MLLICDYSEDRASLIAFVPFLGRIQSPPSAVRAINVRRHKCDYVTRTNIVICRKLSDIYSITVF